MQWSCVSPAARLCRQLAQHISALLSALAYVKVSVQSRRSSLPPFLTRVSSAGQAQPLELDRLPPSRRPLLLFSVKYPVQGKHSPCYWTDCHHRDGRYCYSR